jgi:hypothetical protein
MTLNPIWGNGNRTKKFKISEFKILVGTLLSSKISKEINEPSYEMVDVKITVTNDVQNNRIFVIFSLIDISFSSLKTSLKNYQLQ